MGQRISRELWLYTGIGAYSHSTILVNKANRHEKKAIDRERHLLGRGGTCGKVGGDSLRLTLMMGSSHWSFPSL